MTLPLVLDAVTSRGQTTASSTGHPVPALNGGFDVDSPD